MSGWERQIESGWLYGVITLACLIIGGSFWARRFRKTPESFSIFVGALVGAYTGAKVLFLIAEWERVFSHPQWYIIAASGKTIVGALLGGYAGVEIAKRLIGHREPTGDWFALGVPLAIAAGRLGCLRYGCCPGKICSPDSPISVMGADGLNRWPAVPFEIGFNLLFVVAILPVVLRGEQRKALLKGQLFHLYLISYGCFRFWHEFHRDTPELVGGLTGYHLGATGLVALGLFRAWTRNRENVTPLKR